MNNEKELEKKKESGNKEVELENTNNVNKNKKDDETNKVENNVRNIEIILVGFTTLLFAAFVAFQLAIPFFEKIKVQLIIIDLLLVFGIIITIIHINWNKIKPQLEQWFHSIRKNRKKDKKKDKN